MEPVTAERGGGKFAMVQWCGSPECEEKIKETKATIRCIPLKDRHGGGGASAWSAARTAPSAWWWPRPIDPSWRPTPTIPHRPSSGPATEASLNEPPSRRRSLIRQMAPPPGHQLLGTTCSE